MSREFEIDQELKVLASKHLSTGLTEAEWSNFHHLSAERANRMRPVRLRMQIKKLKRTHRR